MASQNGGKNRQLQDVYGKPVMLESPQDVKRFLGKVINGVWIGKIPLQVAGPMGFLARCWLDAHEASDVDKRLDDLEERIANKNHEP